MRDWVVQQLLLSWEATPIPGPDVSLQTADLYLLTTDRSRVWHGDLEFVYPGTTQTLVETLTDWRRISRGAFEPTDISETWQDERGPVAIDFTLNGTRQQLIHRGGDMLDPVHLLAAVNRMIADSGQQFVVCDALGMPNFIVALTDDEKARIQYERRWGFVPLG